MKTFFLSLIAALALSTTSFAQAPGGFGGGQRMNPEQMAQRRTEMLVQQLGLNEEQAAAVLELTKKQMEQMRSSRGDRRQNPEKEQPKADETKDKKADKKSKGKKSDKKAEKSEKNNNENADRGNRGQRPDYQAQQEQFNAEMKKILTEEQYAKYEEMQKNMRQRGFGQGGRRGQGGPRGNRPQNNE